LLCSSSVSFDYHFFCLIRFCHFFMHFFLFASALVATVVCTHARTGEFRVVLRLLRLLENEGGGALCKAQVDRVLDACAQMQNLREAIWSTKVWAATGQWVKLERAIWVVYCTYRSWSLSGGIRGSHRSRVNAWFLDSPRTHSQVRADRSLQSHQREEGNHRALAYLVRYVYLLLFNSYLLVEVRHAAAGTGAAAAAVRPSFAEFLARRPALLHCLEDISLK
jgi:hypothetical protein